MGAGQKTFLQHLEQRTGPNACCYYFQEEANLRVQPCVILFSLTGGSEKSRFGLDVRTVYSARLHEVIIFLWKMC